jgi:hypothetical protein
MNLRMIRLKALKLTTDQEMIGSTMKVINFNASDHVKSAVDRIIHNFEKSDIVVGKNGRACLRSYY